MAINKATKALIEAAAKYEDQTKTVAGGDFERPLPAEGRTVGRLIEYIELGKQPRKPWKGKERQPADMVMLTFELTHKKNVKEIEKDGQTIRIADKISLTLNKSFSENGNYKALFNKMRYNRQDITHMAQMLDDAFIITVVHNTSKDSSGKETTYANITNSAGEYLIAAPELEDIDSGEKTKLNVPPALSPIRVFLFEHPTKESWDSLFIDGTRTRKAADGTEEEISKNWIQERILSSTNVSGSALEAMLEGDVELDGEIGIDEDEAPFDVDDMEAEEEEEPAPKAPAKKAAAPAKAAPKSAPAKAEAKPAKPVAAKKAKVEDEEEIDPLAALGL